MIDALDQQYQALPECIRQYYSKEQYAWMSDDQRANLIEENTIPDDE